MEEKNLLKSLQRSGGKELLHSTCNTCSQYRSNFKLPPLVSFLARRVSFLSRITEAFSLEYITRKKPTCISKTVLLYSHVSIIECHCNILCVSIDCSIHVEQTYRTFVYKSSFQQRDIFKQVANDQNVTETVKS